ncbi:MAG: DUF456 domain-containing protein [Treponema sp.]|jgi:uncharacterized protein YqgC (DUF456 family)|nr:DUF456 domain-containing protein [Treponema sp.]
MSIILVIFAIILLLTGLLGAILPVLPGPPISFIGLLLLQWSGRGGFSPAFLWLAGIITIAVTVMDYILPALLTKRFGGSRMAVIGSTLGLIAGVIFFPPIGLIIGSFLGALIGELINNNIKEKRSNNNDADNGGSSSSETSAYNGPAAGNANVKAVMVALGAFLAFIAGTGAKLVICSLMIYYAVKALF